MNNEVKNPKGNKKKYVLLFLLILLTALGIWKCPNRTGDKSEVELSQEKEDSLKMEEKVESEVLSEEGNTITKREKSIPEKEAPSNTLPPNKENIPDVNTNKEKKESTTNELEKEADIQNEDNPKKEFVVHKVDENIDKRLPASTDSSCKTTTTFKINKASYQTSVAFSPDGTKIVAGNNNNHAIIMNIDGKEFLKLIGHKGYVLSTKYSPDGNYIVTGSIDKTAKLWNANNGKELRSLEGHSEAIFSVTFSPDGSYILTGSIDYTAILWDAKSGDKLFQLKGHKSGINDVAFSSNGKYILTGSSDKTAKVWDVKSREVLFSLEGFNNSVRGVSFTPNDKLIVTGSSDKRMRVWNAQTGKHLHTINGNNSPIMSISISNDGQYIISTSKDGSVKLWELKSGKELCQFEEHTKEVREAVFHPIQKNTVISAGNDKTIRMWKFELN